MPPRPRTRTTPRARTRTPLYLFHFVYNVYIYIISYIFSLMFYTPFRSTCFYPHIVFHVLFQSSFSNFFYGDANVPVFHGLLMCSCLPTCPPAWTGDGLSSFCHKRHKLFLMTCTCRRTILIPAFAYLCRLHLPSPPFSPAVCYTHDTARVFAIPPHTFTRHHPLFIRHHGHGHGSSWFVIVIMVRPGWIVRTRRWRRWIRRYCIGVGFGSGKCQFGWAFIMLFQIDRQKLHSSLILF